MVTVTGVIEPADGGGHALRLPFRAAEVFGAARPPVRVVADGQLEFRTTLAGYGGDSWLGLRKDQLAELGLAAGDPITVTIEADTEPRVVTPPEELADALAGDPAAAQAFERLSYSHQREYAEWVAEAKQAATRRRRAAKAVEMITQGRPLR
jgi:CRP-like cAMP-binding protein